MPHSFDHGTGSHAATTGQLDRGLLADAILSTALDCIIVADAAGRIVEFNPAAERTFGWNRDQMLNQLMEDTIVPHHHRAAHRHGMERYLAGGKPRALGRRVEIEGLHASGRVFPVELTITETMMQGQRFFVATLRDISEKQAAETALLQARASLQAFFDHVPVGIFINRLGPAGVADQVVEFANDYAGKPYGLTATQLIGTVADDPQHNAAMRDALSAMDHEIARTRLPIYREILNPVTGLHEGHSRFPILNPFGAITHIGGMILDIDERVRARQQLDEVRAQLQSFYDNVPAELYIRELDGTFVTANKWSLDFYGITREDLPNFKAWAFDRDADNRISLQAQEELLATGKPVTREFQQSFSDDLVIMNTIFPVRDAEGRITRIGGFSIDVSELHHARVALQEARANLQAFFDQVPVGMHMNRIGPLGLEDQRVEFANENISKPYGLTVDQFLDRNPYGMAADDGILPMSRQFDTQILRTRRPVHAEAQNPATGRYESYTRFPILNAAGQISHIGGMVIDIDERVRAKDQLEDIRYLLSSIFDNIPAVLYLRELDGTFIMVNAFGASVLGMGDPLQMIGRSAHALDTEAEAETARAAQAKVLETGQPVTQEYTRLVDGRAMVVLNTIFPIRDASAAIIRIGGFATDVTELYNARNQLQRAQESLHQSEKLAALGQLLAGVAHELNNPLAVVLGRAAILQEKLAGTAHEPALQKLHEAASRCARIVKTFLAMARQTGPRRQLVEVNDLIENALEMTTYGLRSAGIAWTFEPLVQGLPIEVDQDQIVQVLINLILNAQHAMEGQSGPRQIALRSDLDPDQQWLHIQVSDTGPGVPPAIAHRIFDPFFTTKPVGQGTGLGLSVCKSMVEAHGGKLDLLDKPGGATFRVSLPALITGTAETGDATPVADRIARRGRFLVVDDEVEIAAILADCLASLGIECVIATDGQSALQRLSEAQFDAVFCDVNMPGMDGITFYRHLRERDPGLAGRLVFVSGDVLHRDFDRVKAAVDRPTIEKPFDPQVVRAAASQLLSDAGATP